MPAGGSAAFGLGAEETALALAMLLALAWAVALAAVSPADAAEGEGGACSEQAAMSNAIDNRQAGRIGRP
jgi:hypothetical protein